MINDVTGAAPTRPAPGDRREPVGQKRAEPPRPHPEPVSDAGDAQAVEQAVRKVREVFQSAVPRVQFEIDADLHRVVVKIVNAESGEVIRQIPQEEVLRLAKTLEGAQGVLLKERA